MADGKDALSDITREEAQAALDNPETGSLRVLKQVGKLRDLYAKELASGKRRLEARNPVEEVAAEAALRDFAEGKEGLPEITIVKDPLNDITREEAQAALDNPETGSLRVLKQVGKLRDLYAKELASGKRRLEARNPVEEVAAEAAARDFTELARAEGKDGPSGITIARVGF